MMKKHKGKDKLKVKIEIQVKKVNNLKDYNGAPVFIYWRRGNSKLSGETTHVTVRNNEGTFEEKITFESKFFIDPKSQKPDEKKLSLQLKEEKKKSSSKVLGKIELDLTSYMNNKVGTISNLSFTKGIKPEPVLTCSFQTIPIKFNDKPLVKVLAGKDASKDPRIVRTIGGNDYFLDKTDSEASDTTVDTSVAEFSNNDYSDDDINDDLGESRKELKQQVDQLNKDMETIENESYERQQRIKQLESDYEVLKKQNKILQDDLVEKENQMESYQMEKENLLLELSRVQMNNMTNNNSGNNSNNNMTNSNGISASYLTEELEFLKQEKIEKMTVIAAQEKEILKLKKQIKQNMLSNSELGNVSGSDLRLKYQSLQQENESQEKLITQLEKEKAELLERVNSSTPTSQKKRIDHHNEMMNGGQEVMVNTKSSSGSIEELRKQASTFKQELDEKVLVEKTIFLAEPQFKGNLPVSGINLFEGLLNLGVLKDSKIGTRVFSSINMALENVYKKCQNDNVLLAYWLSTTILILAKIKNKSAELLDQQQQSNGQMLESPINSFELNLKSIIFKFYSKLIKNAYSKLSPVLVKSILQHDILAFNSGKIILKRKSAPDLFSPPLGNIVPPTSPTPNNTTSNKSTTNQQSNHHPNQLKSNSSLDVLEEFFEILRQNYVHPSIIIQFFSQIFYYINSLLINSLNNIKGLCSCVNGFQMKIELSKIQEWVSVNHLGESIEQLNSMIETSNLLVMDKELLSDVDILNQVCPSISAYNIKHYLEEFIPDRLHSEPLPSTVFQAVDKLISQRGEQEPPSLDMDITYMHLLSLDFLTKDLQYGRERRDVNRERSFTSKR